MSFAAGLLAGASVTTALFVFLFLYCHQDKR